MSSYLKKVKPYQYGIFFGGQIISQFHFNKNSIRCYLELDEKPEVPTKLTDPPHYSVDESVEEKIDEKVTQILDYAEKKKEVTQEGFVYRGDFYKSKGQIVPNGKCIVKEVKGEDTYKVIGEFKEGKLEGAGMILRPNQSIKKAFFKESVALGPLFVKRGNLKFVGDALPDGSPGYSGIQSFDGMESYYKEVEGSEEPGLSYAKVYDSDGKMMYRGGYLKGLYHGEGELFYETRTQKLRYQGGFSDDQFNGYGTLYNQAGDILYNGEFVDNHPKHKWKMYLPQIIDLTLLGYMVTVVGKIYLKR